MAETTPLPPQRPLQLILLAAVVQGWSLYGLSWAVRHEAALAKNSGLLMALYAFATVAPLTLQFLVEHSSRRLTWYLTAAVGVCFAGLGWHFGHNIANEPGTSFFRHDDVHEHVVIAIVLWLLVMPLLQTQLITRRWPPDYQIVFAQGWQNLLTAAEAALFTGLFWGLLYSCDALFRMLGVSFFGELYSAEIFSIPVTWLTFGVALFLIGEMDRLTAVTLQQILGVLKWLAVPAMLIVAFFSVALLLSLPGLVGTGKRTISAGTLLWIVAVIVLLLNAAYRDGETEQPYPRLIGLALRALVPLTFVIAITATWSLYIRANEYGLTVGRVWGWLVALTAVGLTAGYSVCAIRNDRWMRGMNRVNVAVMIALIAALVLMSTPALSPYRLTADSQERLLRAGQPNGTANRVKWRNDLIRELRLDAGEYGKKKLRALAADNSLPADVIQMATAAQAKDYNGYSASEWTVQSTLAAMSLHPKGRTLNSDLAKVIEETLRKGGGGFSLQEDSTATGLLGVFVDLTGDNVEDFAMLAGNRGSLFEHVDDSWRYIAVLEQQYPCRPRNENLLDELAAGRLDVHASRIAELLIGQRHFHATPAGCTEDP